MIDGSHVQRRETSDGREGRSCAWHAAGEAGTLTTTSLNELFAGRHRYW